MVYAIIPAAGIGSRMQSAIPKQYLPLLDGNVLLYSIRALLALSDIRMIMIALHPDDRWWPQTEALLNADERLRIRTCNGGAERWQSVQAALAALISTPTSGSESGAGPYTVAKRALAKKATSLEMICAGDWVLVHDAVRPCVRHDDLRALLTRANVTHGSPHSSACTDGALLASPVADTLKKSDVSLNVLNTVDRSQLWAACTPQMFRIDMLQQALTAASAAGVAITDEASAIEYCGGHPALVPCAKDNIKITYPDDLNLAALILQARQIGAKNNDADENWSRV